MLHCRLYTWQTSPGLPLSRKAADDTHSNDPGHVQDFTAQKVNTPLQVCAQPTSSQTLLCVLSLRALFLCDCYDTNSNDTHSFKTHTHAPAQAFSKPMPTQTQATHTPVLFTPSSSSTKHSQLIALSWREISRLSADNTTTVMQMNSSFFVMHISQDHSCVMAQA